MSGRRRTDDGDDDAEERLGDRRQHAEHRRHDAHQGRRLPDRARCQRPGSPTTWAGPNINGPWGNMAVIDSGDQRDVVRQHGRVRRPGSGGARSRDRLSGDGQQGDGAAHRTGDPRQRPAGDREPDRRRERLRPARRQGCLPDRPDRPGAGARRQNALRVGRGGQPDRRDPRRDDAARQRRAPAGR